MIGYFEIKKASNAQFYFVLKAANHEVILTSEMYPQEASAKKGIASVQANSSIDKHFERKDSTKGAPYF
ncbi:MAG: DUF1508 domain-containing protein, partial [Glaciimonas sp.]|nr:DUF1508 domain-containing protein [Glaciimonas sp.]